MLLRKVDGGSMNRKVVLEALVEMYDRIFKTPVNAARGLPPVCKGDLERWALAIAEASPPYRDGIPLKDLPKWKAGQNAKGV